MDELKTCPFCGGAPEIINCSAHCNNPCCEAQPFTAGQTRAEAIAAQPAAPTMEAPVGVPEGFVLVPVAPDDAMIAAGCARLLAHAPLHGSGQSLFDAWRAMLAAAPAGESNERAASGQSKER